MDPRPMPEAGRAEDLDPRRRQSDSRAGDQLEETRLGPLRARALASV
jgi:hypothetical protein